MAGLLLVWCKYALLAAGQTKNTDASHDWLLQYIRGLFRGISVALHGWYAKQSASEKNRLPSDGWLNPELFCPVPTGQICSSYAFALSRPKLLAYASRTHDYVASPAASHAHF